MRSIERTIRINQYCLSTYIAARSPLRPASHNRIRSVVPYLTQVRYFQFQPFGSNLSTTSYQPIPYIPIQSSTMSSSDSSSAPITRLRAVLKKNQIAAYIVPTADAHQSEYVSEADQRRSFLTGFTGSAGVAVVLAEPFTAQVDANHGSAAVPGRLFTDGRYFLQAAQQLQPTDFELMKGGLPEVPRLEDWLLHVLPQGSNVAIDPRIYSIKDFQTLKRTFKDQLKIVFTEQNLVDEVWGAARPKYSSKPLMVLPLEYTGETHQSKIDRIRAKMAEAKASLLVVSALDQVAWLFNLRGGDIPFNPVFLSYALITTDTVTLYVDTSKVTDDIRKHLGDKVTIKSYESIWTELKGHASLGSLSKSNKIWLDPGKCNVAIYNIFNPDVVLEQDNPIELMKAVKNEVEVKGMRNAHLKDAAAVVNFLSWLEIELLEKKNTSLTECSVSDRLEAFRAEQPEFMGLSFETIAGSGSNGAIIHYKPEEGTCKKVTAEEMFLLDSGGQYKDGTTDITRTIHLGKPKPFEVEANTRVLKGHISLALARFPPNTVGPTLDAFARRALWDVGLDYCHGTGHGVGAFLNVHEGPCGISSSGRSHTVLTTGLQNGMILSNEPGFYQDGEFGIRIESLIVVRPVETQYKFQNRQYLGFETITLVPLQRQLIQVELLSDAELQWLNDFHAETRAKVGPLVSGRAKEWLLRETEPIVRK